MQNSAQFLIAILFLFGPFCGVYAQPGERYPVINAQTFDLEEATRWIDQQNQNQMSNRSAYRVIALKFQDFDQEWIDTDSVHYDYLSNNLRDCDHGWEWDGSAWNISNKSLRNYSASGQLIEEYSQNFDGLVWENNQRTLYEYDSLSGYLKRETYQGWNGLLWNNIYQYVFTHDTDGRILIIEVESWINSQWVKGIGYFNFYDSEFKLDSQVIKRWDDPTSTWNNDEKTIYEYLPNGEEDVVLTQTWDYMEWKLFKKSEFTYTNSDLEETKVIFQWQDSVWEKKTLYSLTHTAANQLASWHQSSWNGSEWIPFYGYFNEYDAAHGGQLSLTVEFWDENAQAFYNDVRHLYYYDTYTPTSVGPVSPSIEHAIYPNPFRDQVQIIFENTQQKTAHLTITNLTGQQVAVLVARPGEEIFLWDGTNQHGSKLPNGIYPFQLRIGETVVPGKVLLNR